MGLPPLMGFFGEVENSSKNKGRKAPTCPCGLEKGCAGPMMKVGGGGALKILVLAEAPGKEEDAAYSDEVIRNGEFAVGQQLIGKAGRRLAQELESFGIDLYKDCWTYNAVNCRPASNRTPTSWEVDACRPHVIKAIRELQPRFILALGMTAVESLLKNRWFDDEGLGGLYRWRGWQAPDQFLKAWVCPTYHPSYVLRCEKGSQQQIPLYFHRDIERFVELVNSDREWPDLGDWEDRAEIVTDPATARQIIRSASRRSTPVYFDYETTGLKPDVPGHCIFSVSLCWDENASYSFPLFPEIVPDWVRFLSSPAGKIAHNVKFEERWGRRTLSTPTNNWVWDTQLGAHVEDNRGGVSGLKFLTYVHFGVVDYSSEVAPFLKASDNSGLSFNSIKKAPLHKLLKYGALDSWFGLKLYHLQRESLSSLNLQGASEFLLEGAITLMDDEENGMALNLSYVQGEKEHLKRRIEFLRKMIEDSEEGKKWRDQYGSCTNWNSPEQLRSILFTFMGLESKKKTAKGKDSTDTEALEDIQKDSALVRNILRIRKLEKIRGTYLSGWERETGPDHVLRPFFHLNIARTYRSSCSMPNLQNVPIRDSVAQKITRRAIYPRAGHVLVEADYSGVEVRTSVCYHKDPNMLNYILDPSTDMHRDTAMECFLLDQDEMTKPIRQGAKNQFVFAEFYGSYWRNTGVGLWKWAQTCKIANGRDLTLHLKKKGIRELGDPKDRYPGKKTFLHHIREVEERFWGERFCVYAQWKEKFWKQYLRRGEFYTLTGFRCTGPMAKNDVVNYPIQGSAFHCLLRSKYNTKRWIMEKGYENDILPCGQIHDSGLFSVNPELLPEFAKAVHYIWGEQLRKEWPWIIVPLEVEVEATPVNGSWYEKAVYHGENV